VILWGVTEDIFHNGRRHLLTSSASFDIPRTGVKIQNKSKTVKITHKVRVFDTLKSSPNRVKSPNLVTPTGSVAMCTPEGGGTGRQLTSRQQTIGQTDIVLKC